MPDAGADGNNDGQAPVAPQPKRQKVSVAGFFGDSDESEDDTAAEDELAEYLALPQVKKVKATEWWREKKAVFPNLEVMARQYLGCPASSASVERLFSAVGIAFADKRQSALSATL